MCVMEKAIGPRYGRRTGFGRILQVEALSRRGRGSVAVSLAVLQQVLGSCERTVGVGADPMER